MAICSCTKKIHGIYGFIPAGREIQPSDRSEKIERDNQLLPFSVREGLFQEKLRYNSPKIYVKFLSGFFFVVAVCCGGVLFFLTCPVYEDICQIIFS